jgi:hypothetical protein
LQGQRFTLRFGKVGTAGQTQTKEFKDEARAKKEHDKLIAEKLAKGYRETGVPVPRPEKATPGPVEPYFQELPGSLPFLQRIAERPDDLSLRLALLGDRPRRRRAASGPGREPLPGP